MGQRGEEGKRGGSVNTPGQGEKMQRGPPQKDLSGTSVKKGGLVEIHLLPLSIGDTIKKKKKNGECYNHRK